VISTPIILQCRSVADLYCGQDGERCPRTFDLHQAPRSRDPGSLPVEPVVYYIVCFSFFFFLASQSSEQRTCLFLLSLCDSVVRLSIVYKKNSFSYLSFSFSLSLAPPWRARTNVTRIRNVQFRKRDAPLSECGTNSRDLSLFLFSLSLSLFSRLYPLLLASRDANRANCFYFLRDKNFFLLYILIFFRVTVGRSDLLL